MPHMKTERSGSLARNTLSFGCTAFKCFFFCFVECDIFLRWMWIGRMWNGLSEGCKELRDSDLGPLKTLFLSTEEEDEEDGG